MLVINRLLTGSSRDLADDTYYVSHGGMVPLKWTAPEAVHFMKYSTASDVWSYGCLLYKIWSMECKPYEGLTNAELHYLLNCTIYSMHVILISEGHWKGWCRVEDGPTPWLSIASLWSNDPMVSEHIVWIDAMKIFTVWCKLHCIELVHSYLLNLLSKSNEYFLMSICASLIIGIQEQNTSSILPRHLFSTLPGWKHCAGRSKWSTPISSTSRTPFIHATSIWLSCRQDDSED